uniref:Uncharacterized protein n=1 Tax=Picea glauca TaxID=3330 RepID=A0A101M561_PICGL|nr:hypothetical protein ABT39_MTgene1128 [Picea glauca]QHR87465.1 hypothetical protein Q903MT_gene1476 [Picea sitchensis]
MLVDMQLGGGSCLCYTLTFTTVGPEKLGKLRMPLPPNKLDLEVVCF